MKIEVEMNDLSIPHSIGRYTQIVAVAPNGARCDIGTVYQVNPYPDKDTREKDMVCHYMGTIIYHLWGIYPKGMEYDDYLEFINMDLHSLHLNTEGIPEEELNGDTLGQLIAGAMPSFIEIQLHKKMRGDVYEESIRKMDTLRSLMGSTNAMSALIEHTSEMNMEIRDLSSESRGVTVSLESRQDEWVKKYHGDVIDIFLVEDAFVDSTRRRVATICKPMDNVACKMNTSWHVIEIDGEDSRIDIFNILSEIDEPNPSLDVIRSAIERSVAPFSGMQISNLLKYMSEVRSNERKILEHIREIKSLGHYLKYPVKEM